jgi:hypothetical protein
MSFTIIAVCCSVPHGQESFEKINSHFGAIASFPLHTMGAYTSAGWGLLGGTGYNFSGQHSAIGEFCGRYFLRLRQLFNRFDKHRGGTLVGAVTFMRSRETIALSGEAPALELCHSWRGFVLSHHKSINTGQFGQQ